MQKKFSDLQKEWYERIKQEGFVDIEYPSSRPKYEYIESAEKLISTQNYYSICADFLKDYNFSSELDREIWNLHSEGYSIRQTGSILKIGFNKVDYRLKKLKIILNIWRKM